MDHNLLAVRIADVAQLTGQFQLRSGLTATTYFDKYQFESDPDLLRAVAEHLVSLIPDDTEILAGLGYSPERIEILRDEGAVGNERYEDAPAHRAEGTDGKAGDAAD